MRSTALCFLPLLALFACSDPEGTDTDTDTDTETDVDLAEFPTVSCGDIDGDCQMFTSTQVEDLLIAVNSLEDGRTIILGEGTFAFDNQLTLRGADEITLLGQGIDVTNLDFSAQEAQSNGVDSVGDDFVIADLTITDAKKDGLRVEDSAGVTIQRLKVTWSGGPLSTNGSYGIYPVKVSDVLIEDSIAENSSDAGIYVGQCQRAIVRNNTATYNVAGIEIENTQYADVYGNLAENNTGGLVIFDLPGNPIVGRDVKVHDNIIRNNNTVNFAPGGTVGQIPGGTGTFAMASRRVEIYDNTYENNDTIDIAIISGLAIESNTERWALSNDELVGDMDGIDLPAGEGVVYNYESTEVWVHGNTHSGSGTAPQGGLDSQPLGLLLKVGYGDTPVDTLIVDATGESAFDPSSADGNSNDHHNCFEKGTGATFGSMDILTIGGAFLDDPINGRPTLDDIFRPQDSIAPFDCQGFSGGPIPDITLQ